MIVLWFLSAYSRVVDWQRFRDIADKVGAYLFVDMAHVAGLVAAGVYPNPVQIADVTTKYDTQNTAWSHVLVLILAKANEEIEKTSICCFSLVIRGGPLMHAIAAKAICFKEAMSDDFQKLQQQVVKMLRQWQSIHFSWLRCSFWWYRQPFIFVVFDQARRCDR